MAASLNETCLDMVTIGATVVTGCEHIAAEECQERLKINKNQIKETRGKIFINIAQKDFPMTAELLSVDNLFVVTTQLKYVNLAENNKEAIKKTLNELAETIEWKKSLECWKLFTEWKGDIFPTDKVADEVKDGDNTHSEKTPKFRVTCNRTGNNHCFKSTEAAWWFGGHLHDLYKWKVDLSHPQLEILLNINDNSVLIGIQLTEESLHKRKNIAHFSKTTLRSTIAYCMVRLGQPQPGDVVCDPFCGTGSISIEGALGWPISYQLGGDIEWEYQILKARMNALSLQENGKRVNVDVCQWDVKCLPLRTGSVDLFVTDLPFGKRCGTKMDNWALYHDALLQMAHASRPGQGRCVLLTQDKKCISRTLQRLSQFWVQKRVIWTNMGGLVAGIYLLYRSRVPMDQDKAKMKKVSRK